MEEIDFMRSYILKSDVLDSYIYCDLPMCSAAQDFCNASFLVIFIITH